jgi:hypothetical protein
MLTSVLQTMEGVSRTASISWGHSLAGVTEDTAWIETEEPAMVGTIMLP